MGITLLACQAVVLAWRFTHVGAVWIDIQTAATGIARVHCQQLWLAVMHDVGKDTLDTLLVEFIVATE